MKVAILGFGPLPGEPALMSPAIGLRTWQLALGLRDAAIDVTLVLRRIPGTVQEGQPGVRSRRHHGVRVLEAPWSEFSHRPTLRRCVESSQPDALLGVGLWGSYSAVALGTALPIWCDLFGDPAAEAQAQASVSHTDRPVYRNRHLMRRILNRGDRFSTVSTPQSHAMLGALGQVGRLNRILAAEDLVAVIPLATLPDDHDGAAIRIAARGEAFRGQSFVVLWSGSYNVWTDTNTLAKGLVSAMEKEPAISFLSTGGEVPGYDDITYGRFKEQLCRSPVAGRCEFRGWVEESEARRQRDRAALGIVIDRRGAEATLGTKARVLEWIGAGLPCLMTEQSELSRIIQENRLGFTVPIGDHAALSSRLVWLARNRDELELAAIRASEFAAERWSVAATTSALVQWCRAPRAAADRAANRTRSARCRAATRATAAYLRESLRGIAESTGIERARLRRKMGE